jgi:uncharacterized protein (DUF488 family)
MTALVVYTAPRSYSGRDRLDITIKQQDAEGRVFAPEASAFRAYIALKKAGLLTLEAWDVYTRQYHDHMAKVSPEHWSRLYERRLVTLVCFCEEPSFCHRRLLAEILVSRGAVYRGERPKLRRGDAAD